MDVLGQTSTKRTTFTLLELGCATRVRLLQFVAATDGMHAQKFDQSIRVSLA
jgi:hypothetical protein